MGAVVRDGLEPAAAGARVLLVDNYSSFTYNLYQYLAELCGQPPLVLRNDEHVPDDTRSFLLRFDAVVLSPGPGHPGRARDFGICSRLLDLEEFPILGVCLGHQGLGLYHGASVERAREAFHGRASSVRHSGDELFAGIPEQFRAVRYHSLAVVEPLPSKLVAIARTLDGELMAMRHATQPHWGVQFHPESAQSEYGKRILSNFCALGKDARVARGAESRAGLPRRGATPSSLATPKPRRWRMLQRELAGEYSAQAVFRCLYADSPSAFWLDGSASTSMSYMGDAEGSHGQRMRFSLADKMLHIEGAMPEVLPCQSIFSYLDEKLAGQELAPSADGEEQTGFCGGYVGYFGYELKAECGATTPNPSPLPDAYWCFCQRFVRIDNATGNVTLLALALVGEDDDEGTNWFDECCDRLANGKGEPSTQKPAAPSEALAPHWRDSREQYLAKIRECQEQILAGESYELCLTTQATVNQGVDGLALFREMRTSNPAPYAAFVRCHEHSIVSASPECFLRIDESGRVESRPIKGTSRRDEAAEKDACLAEMLVNSEKERAENLMIVDLVRNDLGRSCEVGSVVVEKFARLESYATVHQLVSCVSGQLRPGVTALACVAAAFPGGSMTGAPKLRSMEILDTLEGKPRGPYAGSLGYLSLSGSADLSIVIRSAVVEAEQVTIGVGGAITLLSHPEDEYREVLLKAEATLAAVDRVLQSRVSTTERVLGR